MSHVAQYEDQVSDQPASIDPAGWVEAHGDYLYRYAVARVRDRQQAEDLVQETLLAALQARRQFAGRCSERTWLVGILKHKVADYFRRASRERSVDTSAPLPFEREGLFNTDGAWPGHWAEDKRPAEWEVDPLALFEREEFWEVLQDCLAELPVRIASAFWMREVEGLSSEEICKVLNITTTNLWVMLHRARMQLRRGLELRWFEAAADTA